MQWQLKWIKNDQIADTFYTIKAGVTATIEKLEQLHKDGMYFWLSFS